MKSNLLEAGEISNTHGIRGEVRIQAWADSPDFLCQFATLYIDGAPVKVRSSKPHKRAIIASLEGVDDINAAMRLKGKTVSIDRSLVTLPEGRHFLADLVGLRIVDANSGEELGVLKEILTPPAHEVYVVARGQGTFMIPAVDEFVLEVNPEAGYIKVRLIDGLLDEV